MDATPDTETSSLPTVWKIFSQVPLTEEELDLYFLQREETKVVDWLAYPHYKVQQKNMLGELGKGIASA